MSLETNKKAHRWWKNGDHPYDNSEPVVDEETGTSFLSEGEVVRRFRHPDYDGTALCPECGQAYDVHGWIDQGEDGITVHPGDYVVTVKKGVYDVQRKDPLAEQVEQMRKAEK